MMLIGAIIQVCAGEPKSDKGSLAMLWIGRIIAGIGNGQHTSTVSFLRVVMSNL